jgi:Uma2 family endonuclease
MAVQLTRRRFTVDEYYAMARAGILSADDRVELLDGEIVEMPPIGPGHAYSVDGINELLMRRFGDRARVRIQNPIRLNQYNEPEPDFALVRRREDLYRNGHPTPEDVFLVIEVADTTLAIDRRVKTLLYARAALPEVWIIDLQHDLVLVHRDPGPDGYRLVTTARRGDQLQMLAFPNEIITVDELLG